MADWVKRLPFPKPGDDVVISGIAGRFPSCDTLTQFKENLFNKVDLIANVDSRWKSDDPDVPRRTGRINHVDKFDAQFFGVSSMEAHTMDPMGRMLLEHAYEAILDAGINPGELRGTKTGVFMGNCYCESENTWLYEQHQVGGLGIPGCGRYMRANRISNWLGIKGPSYSVDTACSSSMFALDQAYRAIRTGECDAALVGGANLCLHPNVSRQFYYLGVLSYDGTCKSFDADGDGYCRSEAVSVIYLQKSKDAKRIYAQVVHSKTNCDGYKEEGITFPSREMQGALLQQFYEECKIAPSSLAYVEAHGTGTKVGDPVEVDTLDQVFCPGRTTPLRIGTIKSNLGHTEPVSGLCSIAKVLISMESGYIPPNLHYNRPREGIKALEDGRIQVITELTPWEGGYVGVNSFGFGGANAHVLLKSNPKEKLNNGTPTDNMPRLVVVSGRTENAVTTLLDYLENRPVDVEFVRLLHDIHAQDIRGHTHRGYTILPAQGLPVHTIRDVQRYSAAERPVWFVFSGIGAQWTGMGEGLLKVPIFDKAIKKCDAALKPYGLNIVDILTNENMKVSDNILNSFVRLAAVQIGLVDFLTSIGIVPDNVIGQSVGELGCAYADGCLTAEQMILVAYFQGLAVTESEAIRGTTAIVGIRFEEMKRLCPPGIEIACHSDPGSSIISGPVGLMKKLVAELRGNDVFAIEEPCSSIPCHTSLITKSVPKLITRLRKVIPDPKPRSRKWLSTSVSCTEWKTSQAQLCSPEYFANNIISPVLYEETSCLIPSNAITIEIDPHGLLHFSRQSLHKNVINIALTECGDKNETTVLLQAIGIMFQVGFHPKLANLYPDVPYPISRGTPMISPLVRWEHTEEWCMATSKPQDQIDEGERVVEIHLNDEQFEWMSGHVIDGRNLLPATGYLTLIWEIVALMRGELYSDVSVVFEDVRFNRATTITKGGGVHLTLMVQKGSGRFEVVEGGAAVVTGFIRAVSNPAQQCVSPEILIDNHDELDLTSKDIYKEFRLRGYQYTGLFRGLKGASSKGTMGRIAWERNWATFMDNMLQMTLLGIDTRGLFVPTGIGKLVIDTKAHANQIRAMQKENREFSVQVYKDLDIIVSGGIEIRGLKVNSIGRRKPIGDPVLEDFKFVTHRDGAEIGLGEATQIATQIALENHFGIKIKSIEWISETDDIAPENLTSPLIHNFLNDLPLLRPNTIIIAPKAKYSDDVLPSTVEVVEPKKLNTESDALLVVSHGLLASKNSEILKQLRKATRDGGFLLAREPLNADSDVFSSIESEGFDVIMEKRTHTELMLLLRQQKRECGITAVIQVNNDEFTWVPKLQAALKRRSESNDSSRILLISEGDDESGLMGLVNCLRREPGGEFVYGLVIQDLQAPKFSLENPLYSQQLALGLALNVLRPGNVWGSYRFSSMHSLPSKPVHHVRMSQLTRGDLSAIQWVEGNIQPSLQDTGIIEVYYSSLNFRDVMISTGKLSVDVVGKARHAQDNVIGFEYSGRDANGRAVMGMTPSGSFSNLCSRDKEFLWSVPNNWTLEDAATVPGVYGTAYYALMINGKMKKGDKVLIHAGSGGVGQAAITLALHEGCEVFTTVGTPEKRIFIKNQFPQIDDDHIGNSRNTSFEQLILRKTRGQGVDIVLNSLAEEKLQASVRCLSKGGRFLEIGKFDLAANNSLGMEAFLKGITFFGILLDSLFGNSSVRKTELAAMLAEGLKSGAIKPLPRTVFPMDEIEGAFRYMAAGKHVGKVLVRIRNENEVSQSCLPLALPRYYCLVDSSYLILGGLGGFGLELADWLVLRGAKKLVLTSRRGISTGYQRMRIDTWKSYGVEVVVVVGKDPSTYEGCEAILKEALALGPVDAIFNLAVVLKDALYENQTVDFFEESFRVKAWATKQLDKLSRTLCPHLRQFVVFSSVSCGRGNAGQTNYGMANSVMERICERRVAENLPGLAVQWGAVGDVGLVAEMQDDNKEVVIAGTLLQGISSCLQKLEGFLLQKSPVVSSMVVSEKTAGFSGATNILDAVLNIMGLKDLKGITLNTPLPDLGMDSMMAVEIKQTLEREFEVFLTAQDIRCLNFAKLQEMSLHQTEENDDSGMDATIDLEDLSGLKMFIQTLCIDSFDENTCVPLAARADDGQTNRFVLPGIDGSHTVFQSLSRKLKFPTTCLQFGTTLANSKSIEDIADHLIPHVKASGDAHSDFVIAGYSFGSLIAIELVRRLESEGRSGHLVLIDGSPDHLKVMIHEQLTENPDDHLETTFLSEMMNLFYPDIGSKLASVLDNYQTWEEKLAAFTKCVPEDKNLNITSEDLQAICTSIYRRLKAVLNYNSSAVPLLRSPITLLRPTIHSARSLSDDYGLRLLTRGKIEIHFVEGNHRTMLDNDICAAAINGELSADVAECHAEKISERDTSHIPQARHEEEIRTY